MALQRKWSIVSPALIQKAVADNVMPAFDNFRLKLEKILSAPQTSSVHVVARNVEETHFKRSGAFSNLKKVSMPTQMGKKG